MKRAVNSPSGRAGKRARNAPPTIDEPPIAVTPSRAVLRATVRSFLFSVLTPQLLRAAERRREKAVASMPSASSSVRSWLRWPLDVAALAWRRLVGLSIGSAAKLGACAVQNNPASALTAPTHVVPAAIPAAAKPTNTSQRSSVWGEPLGALFARYLQGLRDGRPLAEEELVVIQELEEEQNISQEDVTWDLSQDEADVWDDLFNLFAYEEHFPMRPKLALLPPNLRSVRLGDVCLPVKFSLHPHLRIREAENVTVRCQPGLTRTRLALVAAHELTHIFIRDCQSGTFDASRSGATGQQEEGLCELVAHLALVLLSERHPSKGYHTSVLRGDLARDESRSTARLSRVVIEGGDKYACLYSGGLCNAHTALGEWLCDSGNHGSTLLEFMPHMLERKMTGN